MHLYNVYMCVRVYILPQFYCTNYSISTGAMVSNHLTKYRYKKGIYGEFVEPELNVCIHPNKIDRKKSYNVEVIHKKYISEMTVLMLACKYNVEPVTKYIQTAQNKS